MIERYTLAEMGAVWSLQRRLETWQRIEVLVAQAWAAQGVVPAEAAEAIAAAPPVDPSVWAAREEVTRHDVAAFVDVLADSAGEHGRWVHYGLTSSDILDTALALALGEATDLILGSLGDLFAAVQRRAVEHRNTPMLGRTHGMWAEPTTFGHKLAGFGFELSRAAGRLRAAASEVAFGKVSGAVGTNSTVPPEVERSVLDALGLSVEPAATQVVPRDRHASYLAALSLVGAALERFATEIRHLQRSEVAEVAEPFSEGQKGSSAMPHKHNPILAENVTGMARLLRGYALTGLENVALWHERDISHSSVERVTLPDATIVAHFALARATRIVEGLTVDADRMRANLEATNGLVFSQPALLALVRSGMARDEAYRLVQGAAAAALEDGTHLRSALAAAGAPLDEDALDAVFDLGVILARSGDSVDALAATTL